MGYHTAFREIMRAYEVDRDRAAALFAQRRAEVYALLPRVRAIDIRLSEIGLSLARHALADDVTLLASLKDESAGLQQEKDTLIAKAGIPGDYFTAIYRCALCRDTGYIPDDSGPPARCRCLKQRLIEKFYDLSNVKNILNEENFDTFDLRYFSTEKVEREGLSPHENMQAVYRAATRFVLRFGTDFRNLLLYGDTGLGKTFLCNCIAKDLLDQGYTVLYVTAPRLFKLVEDYRFNRDEMEEPDETLDAVTDVDLLILDDLGSEFATVITYAMLFDVVNQRLLAKKPTVISTNLSAQELEAQYSGRIMSRVLGHFELLKFFGDDIRVKKKYGKRF